MQAVARVVRIGWSIRASITVEELSSVVSEYLVVDFLFGILIYSAGRN